MATCLKDLALGTTVYARYGALTRELILIHKGVPDAPSTGSYAGFENSVTLLQVTRTATINYSNYKSLNNLSAYLSYDADMVAAARYVTIPYRSSKTTVGTTNVKAFALSREEMGITGSSASTYVKLGSKFDYFDSGAGSSAIAKRTYSSQYWLRSQFYDSSLSDAGYETVGADGKTSTIYYEGNSTTSLLGLRFAFVVSDTLTVDSDGIITFNTAPTTPPSITVPDNISGGTSVSISWGASTDAENNLEGYIVERSIDGGSTWTQIYQGSALSTTNTVVFGTVSVMYRVKAYDSEGLESEYRASGQITVTNNVAPNAPASITVPLTVLGGGSLLVTWGIATDSDGNLSGYCLERSVNGGNFEEIYRGTALNYTDSIIKGWSTVAYRVRAYDSYSAYSGYITSEARTVNNNTAPVITCAYANSTNLGTKDSGFVIPYSVSDADNDAITVTEAVGGVVKRTFTAVDGVTNNFQVSGDYFQQILNGSRTLTITATDGIETVTRTLYFTKLVTFASVQLEQAFAADALVTIAVMSVSGSIPDDANFVVKATNNPFDTFPVWQDCTSEVKNGRNIVFENTTVTNGCGFGFKVEVSRGVSNTGGHITSIQGGFE